MGMIKDIWDVGKEIFDLSNQLKKQEKEKRESLATLLGYIGSVIKDTYDKLMQNIYPAGNCEQLEVFSGQLYTELAKVVGETKARSLADKLKQAHEVEKLHAELGSGAVNRKDLELLDQASGHFIAVSKLLQL